MKSTECEAKLSKTSNQPMLSTFSINYQNYLMRAQACRSLLQSRERCLAFGGFIYVICSNRESTVSCLERVGACFAPIVRASSRIWSVSLRTLLHLWERRLAFGGLSSVFCSKPESIVSLLEGVGLHSAPITRASSRVWRGYRCVAQKWRFCNVLWKLGWGMREFPESFLGKILKFLKNVFFIVKNYL